MFRGSELFTSNPTSNRTAIIDDGGSDTNTIGVCQQTIL